MNDVEKEAGRIATIAIALAVAAAMCLGFSLQACAWLSSESKKVEAAVVDCTTSAARDAISQYGPILDALLVQYTQPDGKVNWAPLEDTTKSLGLQVGSCVLASVVAQELAPKSAAGAPKSGALFLDASSLRAGFEKIRRERYQGFRFRLDGGVL